jgi:4-hydroxy-tetrahydrodipicolinate synthase
VPSRTGVDLVPETAGLLSKVPGIVGLKEARADAERIREMLTLRRAGFAVLSGDDPTAAAAMLGGADGVISVASNLVPASFRRLCDAARAGDVGRANSIDAPLRQLYELLGVEPNPIPVKAALAELGCCEDTLRLPLLPLSSRHRTSLRACLRAVPELETMLLSSPA